MEKKAVFCIIGKSGVGKTTYFDNLMRHIKEDSELDDWNIGPLVYHTTRSIRENEDPNAYVFDSYIDYERYKAEGKVLEARGYQKYDSYVVYYTLYDDFNSDYDAYICTASVDQLFSYINNDKLEVYIINIEVPTKPRLTRLLKRCNTDDECYEVCRRALEEDNEYSRLKYLPKDKYGDTYKSNKLDILNYREDEALNTRYILDNDKMIIDFIDKKIRNMYNCL